MAIETMARRCKSVLSQPKGSLMKIRLALLLAVAVSAFPASAAATAPAVSPSASFAPVTVLKSCRGRYVHAIISGEHKCLGTGQYCARRNERIYRRHGFTCKPGSDGRLRLHRR